MRLFTLLFSFFGLPNLLLAQLPDSCYQDPSCRHTKQMLLTANQQWGNHDIGINSNHRSDSIDILHYDIQLDMRNFEAKKIAGFCELLLSAKIPTQHISLDLLQMGIDSILYNNKVISFEYNDTIIDINFVSPLLVGKQNKLKIYYQGSPQEDGSWGGFYYKKDYAFNLGVGFTSNPHNYGRVWHPCFDNFAEKATYSFSIITNPNQTAQCNGELVSRNTRKDKTINNWLLEQPIPTYLACIAVADYTTIKTTYQGIYGAIPIELAAKVADTANLKKSFQHLHNCIASYEYWYGPHRWNKVGYSLVPFNSGAMEHASNIAYPIAAANGSLRRESLMAHELGHSWWGNNVTCQTANDMWINEGMASYSVHLFYEYTYGKKRYLDAVKKNHVSTLLDAHKQEGGYRPISGVPFEYTYGSHVYDKGAVVAHNLRGYLGDSLFRVGLNKVQEDYKFSSINSVEFRDALSVATGVDLTAFFDDWVFTGGYPHFAVSGYTLLPYRDARNTIQINIQQQLLGRKDYHTNVPLEVSFLGSNWQEYKAIINCSNKNSYDTITLPFHPVAIIPNKNHWLNQATIDFDAKVKTKEDLSGKIGSTGFYDFKISTLLDSVYLHFSKHLVPPTGSNLEAYLLDSTYWSIKGILSGNIYAKVSLKAAQSDKILLYRIDSNYPWFKQDSFSQKGKEFSFPVKTGDYCFATPNTPVDSTLTNIATTITSEDTSIKEKMTITTYGNKMIVEIKLNQIEEACIQAYDSNKRILLNKKVKAKEGKNEFKLYFPKNKKAKHIRVYGEDCLLINSINIL